MTGSRKTIRKQFGKGNFKLPQTSKLLAESYNSPNNKSSRVRWRYRWWFLSLIAIIVVIYSPLFKIKNTIINNVESNITRDYIRSHLNDYLEQKQLFILPQDNLLLFSPEAAKSYLSNSLVVDDIVFDRQFPNVLRLKLSDRIIVGLWQAGGQLYTLDKRGVVLQLVEYVATESKLVTIVSNKPQPQLYDRVIDELVIKKIDLLTQKWLNTLTAKIDKILYDESKLPTIELVTKDGWRVFMSLYEDTDTQINLLNQLILGKLKEDLERIDYIEVRFGNRLYYTFK